MKFKKFLIVICLFICLLTMASVCAGDSDNTIIQSGNDTQDDIIGTDEINSQDMMGISEDDLCGASFKDLQSDIDNAKEGDEIVLNKDYSLDSSENPLKISKSITLKGNGSRTLNGNWIGRIINIDANEKSITFENIIFQNGKESDKGGAILNTHSKTSLTFINCQFNDNKIDSYGGAVYSDGDLNFNNCEFYKNYAGIDGGAVYGNGETTVTLSSFKKNDATGSLAYRCMGGAIHNNGNLYVSNSSFENNLADIYGGAIYCEGKATISFSQFRNNKLAEMANNMADPYGGAIYSKGKCIIDSCIFNGNWALDQGGAIYAEDDLIITRTSDYTDETTFKSNSVEQRGGAIYACKDLYINWNSNSYTIEMNDNRHSVDGAYSGGGAIYCEGNSFINNTNFISNYGHMDGGAIYCKGKTTVMNSKFDDNTVVTDGQLERVFGGAICSKGLVTLNNCSFDRNYAEGHGVNYYPGYGGAIYAYGEISITDCSFKSNYAEYAGAIFATKINYDVLNSTFIDNSAFADCGGAIYIDDKSDVTFTDCRFEDNYCHWKGGAVFSDSYSSNLVFENCTFINNAADCDGGAIYSSGLISVTDSEFEKNNARGKTDQRSFGGAIFSYDVVTVYNSRFKDNSASHLGGAIYADYNIGISGSSFESNSAKNGGAVYASMIDYVSRSAFNNNKASTDDGGAIYINNKCDSEFTSCSFNGNKANNRGGAIYLDSLYGHLKVSYCSFVDNHADKEKYSGNYYHGAGHSIFNSGNYDLLDMVWMGTNSPSFKGEFVEYHTWASDEDHSPKNYLKIGMKINETEFFVGNTYETTVYLYASNGDKLKSDVLHSACKFTGAAEFSNVKVDGNEMTADAKMLYAEGLSLYGDLDHQEVSVFIDVKNKNPSKVHIISCEDVKYPNQIKLNYEIFNMSDDAFYIIKDSQGKTVKQEKLNSANSISVGPFEPGSYSLTIINPETRTTLASSDNATFTVNKGDMDLSIVVFNETYGDISEVILHSNANNVYNYTLTVTGNSSIVVSKTLNFSDAYRFIIGVLDAGNYTAEISFEGNEFYNPISNDTRFVVHPAVTSFELEITSSEISYGETATVIPIFKDKVTGNITYHLHNGTFIAKLPVNKNLTLSGLNAGVYVIVANYSGDKDYQPAFDSTKITVKKANPVFEVVTNASDLYYGENVAVSSTLSVGATGTVVYYLGNGTVIGEGAVGEKLKLPILDAGDYVIKASYSGDNNYMPGFDSVNITVKKANPVFEVVIDASDLHYGKIVTVSSSLPVGATGTVVYYLGNGTMLGEVAVGEKLKLPILDAGDYVIKANYSGDKNYLAAFDSVNITVKKANPEFEVVTNTTDLYYGKIVAISSSLPVRATGTVVYYLSNGTILGEVAVREKLKLPILDAGVYVIIANYSGDRNFENVTVNSTLNITKAKTQIMADSITMLYTTNETLVITLKSIDGDPVTGVNVTVVLNGAKNYTTDEKGQVNVSICDLSVNVYDVVIIFGGNKNYMNSSNTTSITVNKMPSKLTTTPLKTTYMIQKYLVINLKDDLNHPICNLDVFITIKGVPHKCRTDGKGNARLLIGLPPNDYTAKVTFSDANYGSATAYVKVTVLKAKPKITAKKKTFKKAKKVKKYTVKVKFNGKPVSKLKLTLKIKGKTYKATSKKGKATFKIKKFTKKGKFYAKITSKRNSLYKQVTKKVRIVIK